MDKLKFNSLAEKASGGCEDSRDKILRVFSPIIAEESRKLWYKVSDETSFEWECYQSILRAIKNFDNTVNSFYSVVYKRIKTTAASHVKRRGKERNDLVSIEFLAEQGRQPTDVLADVESIILLKEKVALISKGDSKREMILNYWKDGFTNESDLADLLAQVYKGKKDSHRKFIQRFRTDCQNELNRAV